MRNLIFSLFFFFCLISASYSEQLIEFIPDQRINSSVEAASIVSEYNAAKTKLVDGDITPKQLKIIVMRLQNRARRCVAKLNSFKGSKVEGTDKTFIAFPDFENEKDKYVFDSLFDGHNPNPT